MVGRLSVLTSAVCFAIAALAGCGKPVDLKQALQVTDVSSGWFDAGIVDGKNKLVPSVTFRLKKQPAVDISSVALNVAYKYVDDHALFDEVYVQRRDFSGDQTQPITVRATVGYTGDPPQSRADMLKHSMFRDMEAQIFAKAGSSQWADLHHLTIVRQLLTK
jgi:hypothetical protein